MLNCSHLHFTDSLAETIYSKREHNTHKILTVEDDADNAWTMPQPQKSLMPQPRKWVAFMYLFRVCLWHVLLDKSICKIYKRICCIGLFVLGLEIWKTSCQEKTNQSELNGAVKKKRHWATLAKLVCLTGLSYCVVQPLTSPAISTVNFPSFSPGGNSCLLQLQLESDVLVFSSQACEVFNSTGSCLLMSIYCFAGHGYHFL